MFQTPTDPGNQDEIINDFPELFDCFSSEGFDLDQFKLFARNFFRNKPERTDKKEWDKFEKEKAKIVSVFARNLYTLFTLSRDQIKNITTFWKTMIVFISPESEATAYEIRVSYRGCLQVAQKSVLRSKQDTSK